MCYSWQCCILNPHGNQECNEQEEAEFRQPNGRKARPEKNVIQFSMHLLSPIIKFSYGEFGDMYEYRNKS